MSEKDTRNVHQRILDTMKVVQYVQKIRKNGVPYPLVGHDDVTRLCRGELLKNGVHYSSSVDSITQSGNRTEVLVTTKFVCTCPPAHGPISLSVTMAGYGIDSSDKGPGKAISYACKYALLKTLGLETGEDSDYQNVDYDADTQPDTPPELAQVTQQATDGRAALAESVQKWLDMGDPEVKALAHDEPQSVAIAISAMIAVYYGPKGWFKKHIKNKYPEAYGDGKAATIIENVKGMKLYNTFIKYRTWVFDMVGMEKHGYDNVKSRINVLHGMKAGVDIYSKSDEEFSDMVQKLHNELKG